MSDDILSEIKKTNKLLAISIVSNLSFNEKITSLIKIGFTQQEIADVLGTTKATINTQVQKIKKTKNGKTKSEK